MGLEIIEQDIITLEVDAIVNAANKALQMGGGVCGAIFQAAGSQEMQQACDAHGPIETGEAVLTPGFQLQAAYVIHTVGPIYSQSSKAESERLLRKAYRSALHLAEQHGLKSIAFPLISSGIYGYPPQLAYDVACDEISKFLENHSLDVYLVLFNATIPNFNQMIK